MKKLTTLQTLVYNAGGLLLIAGAALPMFTPAGRIAPFVYAAGASMFCTMQMLARYEGNDLTVRRLRRQQLVGSVLLLAAAALMFMSLYRTGPFQGAEWQMALALGAVFEVYTAFRLPAALKKAGEEA